MTEKWEKMAEAREKLRKEAEEEKTFIKGLGFWLLWHRLKSGGR
jgi:hypothetical protein